MPGPCQFPTLGFVVQRFAYVKVFRPETFWYIYLSLTRQTTSQGQEEIKFNWKRHHCFGRVETTEIFSLMKQSRLARVTKVNSKVTKKWYEINF
jgi:DNA topoisomerase-3